MPSWHELQFSRAELAPAGVPRSPRFSQRCSPSTRKSTSTGSCARRSDLGRPRRRGPAAVRGAPGAGRRRHLRRDGRGGHRARSSGASTRTASPTCRPSCRPRTGSVFIAGLRSRGLRRHRARSSWSRPRPPRPGASSASRCCRAPTPPARSASRCCSLFLWRSSRARGVRRRLPRRRRARALRDGDRDVAVGGDSCPASASPTATRRAASLGLRLVRRHGAARSRRTSSRACAACVRWRHAPGV